jgi:hypothetical protein
MGEWHDLNVFSFSMERETVLFAEDWICVN